MCWEFRWGSFHVCYRNCYVSGGQMTDSLACLISRSLCGQLYFVVLLSAPRSPLIRTFPQFSSWNSVNAAFSPFPNHFHNFIFFVTLTVTRSYLAYFLVYYLFPLLEWKLYEVRTVYKLIVIISNKEQISEMCKQLIIQLYTNKIIWLENGQRTWIDRNMLISLIVVIKLSHFTP